MYRSLRIDNSRHIKMVQNLTVGKKEIPSSSQPPVIGGLLITPSTLITPNSSSACNWGIVLMLDPA